MMDHIDKMVETRKELEQTRDALFEMEEERDLLQAHLGELQDQYRAQKLDLDDMIKEIVRE